KATIVYSDKSIFTAYAGTEEFKSNANEELQGYLQPKRVIGGAGPLAYVGAGEGAPRIIESMSSHAVEQAITRGFRLAEILRIIKNGNPVLKMGRYGPQWRYMAGGNTVIVNATTN